MALLTDFLPIVAFFVVFKLKDIYWATGAIMAATAVVVAVGWVRQRRLQRLPLIALLLVMIFGGATLCLHEARFIMWKPTVAYGLFALAFLVSQFVGKAPLAKRIMGQALVMPDRLWRRLNLGWMAFFILLGVANVVVFQNYSQAAWVNFKLFGVLGAMVLFCVGQAVLLRKYLRTDPAPDASPPGAPPAEPPVAP